MILVSCAEKEFDQNNPQASFSIAKEPYDEKNYDIALKKLGEFKSRFPYSKYAVEAELLIANTHFELGHYIESSSAYNQFIKLHPKHPQVDYAMYRVGLSYWNDAPTEIDREQEFTETALKKWNDLTTQFPQSPYTKEAADLITLGGKRIADAEEFIARFYCKQEIWHACAYRYIQIPQKFPQDKERSKKAYLNAATALEKLADTLTDANKDKNLYFRDMTKEELFKKAQELRSQAQSL